MSTLVEIQEAITRLGGDEKCALSLWLQSLTAPALTALDEQRLLRSLDEAIRDVDTGKGVPLEEGANWWLHGLEDSLRAAGHRGPGRSRPPARIEVGGLRTCCNSDHRERKEKGNPMNQKSLPLTGLLLMLLAVATPVRAQFTLFEERFESGNLNQWTGKAGLPHHGQIVTDPLNSINHVLTFSDVNAAGDIFSASRISVDGLPRRFILSFDFLGLPIDGVPPSEYGGFTGVTTDPAGVLPHYWLAGTYLPALNVPAPVATVLTADGLWHHYEVDFTEVVVANGLTSFQLMLEDWYDRGSIPGDVYFDNVRLAAPLDIEQRVPCAGPLSGGTWKNHGEYVSSVVEVVKTYVQNGLLTEREAETVIATAANSECGRK